MFVNKIYNRYSTLAALALLSLLWMGRTSAYAEHLIRMNLPPEMVGDHGGWWLDIDSISDGSIRFFTFFRTTKSSTEADFMTLRELGKSALDCRTGNQEPICPAL